MFPNSSIASPINPSLHIFRPWWQGQPVSTWIETFLFPDRGQTHTSLNQTPLPSLCCRCTYDLPTAHVLKLSQGTWPASQQASHRLRKAAESLGWEPAIPTLWEAKSLIYCCLFSFSTQPSLESVTHLWSAVTSDQILFGVLLLKKITSQP